MSIDPPRRPMHHSTRDVLPHTPMTPALDSQPQSSLSQSPFPQSPLSPSILTVTKTNQFLERYARWGFPQEPLKCFLTPAIRLNPLKADPSKALTSLRKDGVAKCTPVPWLVNGYTVSSAFSLASTPSSLNGYFYIQEIASQIPVMVLDPKPDDVVIDLCAAPGSKTTQAASLMRNTGVLIALERSAPRAQRLAFNLERCGVTNCVVLVRDAVYVGDLAVKPNKMLLDAPCSGNFAIDKNWFTIRRMEDFPKMATEQRRLLGAALDALAPGGTLVYSTCSLEIEEDEHVVEWALARSDVILMPIDIPVGSPGLTAATAHCKRLWPTQHGTQGFFIAKFVKKL